MESPDAFTPLMQVGLRKNHSAGISEPNIAGLRNEFSTQLYYA